MHRYATGLVAVLLMGTTACSSDLRQGHPWQFPTDEPSDVGLEPEPDSEDQPGLDAIDQPDPTVTECRDRLPEPARLTNDGGDVVNTRLAIGPGGCPRIVYYREEVVAYTFWDGTSWKTEEIAEVDGGNWEVDIAVDPDGGAAVSFTRRNRDQLYFARRTGPGDWRTEKIADLPYIWATEIAFNQSGRPYVAVARVDEEYRGSNPRVLVFWRADGTWQRRRIHAKRQLLDLRNGLAFDSQERPHLAMGGGGSNDHLFYFPPTPEAEAGNPDWRVEELTDERWVAASTALALNQADRPHIFYCSGYNQKHTLGFTYRRDDSWSTDVTQLDSDEACRSVSAAFDDSGQLHFVYLTNHQHQEGNQFQYTHKIHHRLYTDPSSGSGGHWTTSSLGVADAAIDSRTGTVHTLANEKCDGCDQRVVLYDRPFAERH